ncbi:16S rRNA (guanine(527)-N(7))-methyltransferase RsmG [Arsenicitalea aurantiaca]|uniref:Ribosomal RNA small subunit methyltransferase G n=1 Tax=Arsenicitalea aurantiaca TaxID=1783274 RepID=A0A433X7W4_9HYPH|nr:16S rRNA (guanine(527)-N(7))-methyltransferase RsmG [Arsenicitalea aurantiaca]RUT30143.1 16S rRNA (guanine(527)-N(7))-methyltransferase RsmG [Arsenicitalea aurantiaca]
MDSRRDPIAAFVGDEHADRVLRDLESFCSLVRKWQPAQNLVSRETVGALWDRHILDSLQLHTLFGPTDLQCVDLGSGGGFPALPLAIAAKGSERRFLLVESNARKAAFLRAAARELGVAVRVASERAESLDSRETVGVDIVTARALAPLDRLFGWVAPFMSSNTRAILPKGREHVEELALADALWQYDVVMHQSSTDPEGVILEIANLHRKTR